MPRKKSSPPHTPHGSWRSRAPARQAILAAHPRHMALAVSTSCGDSAKNRSGSSVQGSTDPVRATGTMARAAPGEATCCGAALSAPWPLPVPRAPAPPSLPPPPPACVYSPYLLPYLFLLFVLSKKHLPAHIFIVVLLY